MQHSPSEEYRLIKSIGAVLGACSSPDKTYPLTLGDDAAVRRSGNERLIITADISVENVHFTLDTASFREIGYKAMV
nr:hypothetical protein [Chitinispirillaceae bacterium]